MDVNWARRMAATMADSLGPTKGTPTVQRRVRNLDFLMVRLMAVEMAIQLYQL
jgi:hypothetical protein